ncbi:MAG: hypothetical protein AB7P37_11875 [Ramlibacter sp.]
MSAAQMFWSVRRGARVTLRRVGWGAVLASALLAVLLALAALDWHLRRAAQAAVAGDPAAGQPLLQAAPLAGSRRSLDEELDAFAAQLPPADEAMQVLGDLFVLAEKHQLVLARGEYRLQPEKAGGFVRLKMSLPVKGQARVVQRFVNEAMRAHPSLAFDALALKRDRIDADAVEARVQWSLLLRADAAQPARTALAARTRGGS